jgi:hypothetical protein
MKNVIFSIILACVCCCPVFGKTHFHGSNVKPVAHPNVRPVVHPNVRPVAHPNVRPVAHPNVRPTGPRR